jgi:hypothetical protein
LKRSATTANSEQFWPACQPNRLRAVGLIFLPSPNTPVTGLYFCATLALNSYAQNR